MHNVTFILHSLLIDGILNYNIKYYITLSDHVLILSMSLCCVWYWIYYWYSFLVDMQLSRGLNILLKFHLQNCCTKSGVQIIFSYLHPLMLKEMSKYLSDVIQSYFIYTGEERFMFPRQGINIVMKVSYDRSFIAINVY